MRSRESTGALLLAVDEGGRSSGFEVDGILIDLCGQGA